VSHSSSLGGSDAGALVDFAGIEQIQNGQALYVQHLSMPSTLTPRFRLYPATSTDDVPIEDSLAATLLRTLGIPEVPARESRVT